MTKKFPGWNHRGTNPCCPSGCYPCGSAYYTNGGTHVGCCSRRRCGGSEIQEWTDEWVERCTVWLKTEKQLWCEAESQWRESLPKWLKAERKFYRELEAWVQAERDLRETLTVRKPKVALAPQKANAPKTKATEDAKKKLAHLKAQTS